MITFFVNNFSYIGQLDFTETQFLYARCSCMTTGTVPAEEKLCNGIETVKGFSYLDCTLNAAAFLKQLNV